MFPACSLLISMKHRCTRLLLGSFLALLTLPSALHADVVVMKDGKKYEEAKIISETPETVTFSYVMLKKFPDTRTEPKANIAQIIKQKPEETEVLPLLKMVPTPDLLTADKYESMVQDTLRPFVTKYPGTPQAKQVEDIIKTLQEEKEKVVGGSLKVEGEWVSAESVKRDVHSIDAFRVRRDMRDLAAAGKYRDALNEWQKMSDLDEGYTDTVQYVKAIPEVLSILDAYKKQLDTLIAAQPELDKRRKDSIAKMIDSDPVKARTQSAITSEVQAFKSEQDVEKKSHARWLVIYKYDLKSLQDAVKTVIDESSKLRALDIAKLTAQNEALVAASRFLAAEDVVAAEAALRRASAVTGLHGSNKAVQNMNKRLAALKKEQNDKLRAKKTYGAGNVGAITSSSTTGSDSRVAETLERIEREKAEKEKAKQEAKNTAPTGDAVPEKPAPKTKKSAASPKTDDSAKKAKPATAAAVVPEEESGIQKYLVPAGGGLLAILVAVLFFQKKKKG
ncbi:MAG: hypothetical protein JWO94_1148 [Verrucomicrobiaceae bacterium]|nr:hypothetical protein [Verrucomicrobiaceae bacterium]